MLARLSEAYCAAQWRPICSYLLVALQTHVIAAAIAVYMIYSAPLPDKAVFSALFAQCAKRDCLYPLILDMDNARRCFVSFTLPTQPRS